MLLHGRLRFSMLIMMAVALLGGGGCDDPPAEQVEPVDERGQTTDEQASKEPLTYQELPTVKGWEKEPSNPFFGRGFYMVYSHKDYRIHMTVYVYDPDGESVDVEAEYARAANDIETFSAYSKTERKNDQMVPWGEAGKLKLMRYVTVLQNVPKASDTFVTSRGGKVIKIRLTRSIPLKPDEEAEITKLLNALAKAILA